MEKRGRLLTQQSVFVLEFQITFLYNHYIVNIVNKAQMIYFDNDRFKKKVGEKETMLIETMQHKQTLEGGMGARRDYKRETRQRCTAQTIKQIWKIVIYVYMTPFDTIENIVAKGEIALHEQFHLLPQCFPKPPTSNA